MLYKERKIKAICIECKKEYTKIRKYQKFCTRKCQQTNSTKRKIKKQLENGEYNKNLKLRFEILKRDNFKCQYCGRNPKQDDCILHIDHIIPSNKGGKNTPENLITSCKECNCGKSDVLLKDKFFI